MANNRFHKFCRWLPVLSAMVLSIIMMSWAAYEEENIQQSIYLPGGMSFYACLPSRYSIYCEMENDLSNKEAVLSNMRLFPTIACEVRGIEHLDVLRPDVWRSGGLTRFIKDKTTGKTRMLMPFAEFEILWPGPYALKAGFIGASSKKFLMTVIPTGLWGSACILSLILLIAAFFWQIRPEVESKQSKKDGQQLRTKNIEEADESLEASP